jgi:hypothetical protein
MRRVILNKIAFAALTVALGSAGIASDALAYGGGCFGHACGTRLTPTVEGRGGISHYPDRSSVWRQFNSGRARDRGRP